MTKGIYKIENIWDGKVYIGESNDIETRWQIHKEDLNNNKHHSYKLQQAWNKDGEVGFTFEIIQEIENNLTSFITQCLLFVYEDKYIKQYNSINNGYNVENTLTLLLKGDKSIFEKYKMTDKMIWILKGVIKNISDNNGIYIPSQKVIKSNPKLKPKLIKETKPKNTKPKVNENNMINIINDCLNYEFKEEFETMAQVFNSNNINCSKAYQILVSLNILYKDNNGKYMPTTNNDKSMFQRRIHSYCDKNTEEIKSFLVTYINKKGFEYLLYILLDECKNNNINIFHLKYLEELNKTII